MKLLLSVRLLDDRFHGLTANGEKPEWPPSSFRLFQAIVAGNAKGESIPQEVVDALLWLETLEPPEITVPNTQSGRVLLTYVPNNAEGGSRTQKFIRPTLLNGDRLIEFLWNYDPLDAHSQAHTATLMRAVHHVRAFGWGIDLAIGHGRILETLPEKSDSRLHFVPTTDSNTIGTDLRSPRPGSLLSLQECYKQYLGRFKSNESTVLESTGPIYQLQAYTVEHARPFAVFKLLDENEDPFRYPHAKLIHIAGMVRHLAIRMMASKSLLEKLYPIHDQANDPFRDGDPPSWIENSTEWVERVVAGHRDKSAGDEHQQFSYVPLPSIGHAHADAMIRNVMIVAPVGMERELHHLADRLDGLELKCEGADSAPNFADRIWLQRFSPPPGKFIAECYLGTRDVWETVTPVILDGHRKAKLDDAKAVARTTERLIRKALARAGIEATCEFTWQMIPFIKNALSAHEYDKERRRTGYFRPRYLQGRSAVHVRLRFGRRAVKQDADSPWTPIEVSGPLTIGAGRHCGFGLLTTAEAKR